MKKVVLAGFNCLRKVKSLIGGLFGFSKNDNEPAPTNNVAVNTEYDVILSFHSARNWIDAAMWDEFLPKLEDMLDTKLDKLDRRDPLRHKADTTRSEGSYIINFGPDDMPGPHLFGTFKKKKTFISIHPQRIIQKYKDDFIPNRLHITLHVQSANDIATNLMLIDRIFELGNVILKPFYSYCDIRDIVAYGHIINQRPGLNIQLYGIYYLTHFGKAYVDFFGDKLEKLKSLAHCFSSADGLTLKLADTPDAVTYEQRCSIIKILGEKAFGAPSPVGTHEKIFRDTQLQIGEYVLDAEKLLSYENIVPIDVIDANIARAHDYCEGLEQQTISVPLEKYRQFEGKIKKMPQKIVKEMETLIADFGDPCSVLSAQSAIELYSTSMDVDADALEYIFSEIPSYMNFDAWDCVGTLLTRAFEPMKWSKCKAWEYKDKDANIQFCIILHKEDDTTSDVYISSIDEALIAHMSTSFDKTLDAV